MSRHLRAIELTARIGDETVRLRRGGRGNRHELVEVRDETGTLTHRLPVQSRNASEETLSDWLLDLLGIRDKLNSVSLGRGGNAPLTFDDLLHYLYLPQDSLDQRILFPASHDERRRALFDLLFDLSNPEWQKLQGEIRKVDKQIRSTKTQVNRFRNFLSESETTNVQAITSEIATLKQRERDAVNRLSQLRDNAQNADSAHAELRRELEAARARADTAEARVDQVDDELREARRRVTALDRESFETTSTISHVEHCPACRTDLTGRETPPGHCGLCHEPLTAPESANAGNTDARQRAVDTVTSTEARAGRARDEAKAARAEVDRLRTLLNERSATTLAPFTDAISEAAAEVETIRTRLSMLDRLREPHDRIRQMQDEILDLRKQREELENRKNEIAPLVVDKESFFETLNNEFRDAIDIQQVPWYAGRARIDPDTYLPVVDGQSFHEHGSGVKCAIAVAYSVALMSYAIKFGPCDMPMLLVIDSPRKNVGNNDEDLAFSRRIYRNFLDQIAVRGELARPYQVIVADNDLPEDIAKQVKLVSFDYPATPFIPGIEDPHGEEDDEVEQRYYGGEPD
ncbi:hypothetical protein [Actinopolyspora mortivallis]|uniref:DUF2326 domain-containing protein n=1 Tax=Actinopolyspora mortivallis TaxID=33906 RepID=A0A2T0GT15_ACTMO|nr:hypothetical protein [Actinopolyspora mortivallis]PRW62183.1 hypothetical protein CEP50_16775 [Actinopolyspora mortivallis]